MQPGMHFSYGSRGMRMRFHIANERQTRICGNNETQTHIREVEWQYEMKREKRSLRWNGSDFIVLKKQYFDTPYCNTRSTVHNK